MIRRASGCCLPIALLAVLTIDVRGEAEKTPGPEIAKRLPMTAVRVTGGPLKVAQDLDADILLRMEPDRMMAGFRLRAGLEPKAEGYSGWDSVNGKQLTGHIAGHYLSAVSYMYAATGDARFKEKADYLVKEMAEVQEKRGNGYLGAIVNAQGVEGAAIFEDVSKGNIRSGGFDMNGLWSPWYTLHKIYAGLRDAYRFTGNKQALEVETKFAGWAEKILAPLSDAQIQQMLNTEHGGMNEIMVDLYVDTADPRWLELSYKFEHRRFTDPLKRHQDFLSNQHGNTNIPKMIGSLDRYVHAGTVDDLLAASYFWDAVVQHHTFATGGNSQVENFPQTDRLGAASAGGGRTNESCNVYNMLKLTREMFSIRPDAEYADYQERALFNHVLASIDPTDGWMSYMVPIGQGVQQEYERNMLNGGFTCCTGSGLESHALHGDGIYYENGKKLWVNIYVPSTADWSSQGAKLTMDTDFPVGESAKLKIELGAPKELTIALRRPYWAGDGFRIKVNGEDLPQPSLNTEQRGRGRGQGGGPGAGGAGAPGAAGAAVGAGGAAGQGTGGVVGQGTGVATEQGAGAAGAAGQRRGQRRGQGQGQAPQGQGQRRGRGAAPARPPVSSYVEITRTWKSGDTIELVLPKSLRLEPTPDVPTRVAIMYGPLVLAGDLGARGRGRGAGAAGVPTLVAADRPVQDWLKAVDGEANVFRTDGVGRLASAPNAAADITLRPFYATHRRTYAVYFDTTTPSDWESKGGAMTPEERRRRLEEMTVAFAQPGQMQPERDFNYQSSVEQRPVEELDGRNGRAGEGWFSFDVPVEAGRAMKLLVTFNRDNEESKFDILVDGTRVGGQPAASEATGFHDVEYPIPIDATQGKQKVTVKFQAGEGGRIAPIYGVRMVRVVE